MTEKTKYRVYLKLKVGKQLDSKETSVTALVGGRTVTIQSERSPQPLSEATWLVFDCRGFETPDLARDFGEALQRATHMGGLCSRVGVNAGDPGDDRTKSWFNPDILHAAPGANPDLRVGPDVHGVVVLPDDGNTLFVRARAELATRTNAEYFIRSLEESFPQDCPDPTGSPSIRRAIRVMNLAEINDDPIAKVALSVSTVEGLAQEPRWTDEQRDLIDAAASWIERNHGTDDMVGHVVEAIRKVRKASIRQRVKKLLVDNGLSHLWPDWETLYGKRSQLLHGPSGVEDEHRGSHLDETELHRLGQEAVKLCATIVLSLAKGQGFPVPERAQVHFGV